MSSPISTPKGGGAVSGLGEKFSPDLFTGTGNFSVPIALPAGRNGFQPELGLQYSTGSGNSIFGLGWNLSVPGVVRKTAKGVPIYDDEKDTFLLSGTEDLMAVKRLNLNFNQSTNEAGITPLTNEVGIITQYRPRTEGLFARIYHLKTNLRNCWKVMSKNGLTSWYGSKDAFIGDLSLVQNPEHEQSIFNWKLTRTEDTFGNHILYLYEKEQVKENEYHRWDQNYLKEIKYADYVVSGQQGYMVSVLFNYEERLDAYSDFKSGIEIRTTKRCKNIEIYTHPIEGEIKTRTYHFQYSDEVLPAEERPNNGVALLCKVEVEGHNGNNSEFLPPLEFRYTHFKPKQQKFKKLEGDQLPLSSLANPGFELIDLFGNGLQDIVQIEGVVRYWRNIGDGRFDAPRIMKDAPTGFSLGDPDVQLVDANGDGRTDLLVNGTNMAGYFSMKHDASWDTKAFKKYKYAPSFSFNDPEVKMMDMTGDGITDVVRNGAALEIFFHDKDFGWTTTKRVPKKQIEDFPNVSFADPRIKLADMSGDGMQDIVQVYNGSIKYWPNKGYGNFGKPVVMKNAPRFQQPFDPSRLQLADIDGDGQADLIYIDTQSITFWINQSGNGWSEPFEITGTPFVTNINGVRVTDIYGNGTAGVLYSFDAMSSSQRHRWFFLDLTGGVKPYLLHEMDNNMGALTRVGYLPSTRYYLKDQFDLPLYTSEVNPAVKPLFKNRKPWKTTLPFPVQVVSRVEVIDELSKGKLTTEYVYHHGYWDGGEREFRGFGRVEQRDTETFERYNESGLHGEQAFDSVSFEHYSPPTETRNWFHLGPIGDEFGEWKEIDFSDEYWQEDPNVLPKDEVANALLKSLPHRAKRDAIRVWRGSSLRSELYALDEFDSVEQKYVAGMEGRPYTVSESEYGIRLEAAPIANTINSPLGSEVLFVPKETSGYVFFSFAISSRTTQWERGYDPMTQLSFTTDFDDYGQPRKQLSAALPRGILTPYNSGTTTKPVDEGGGPILATAAMSTFAQKNDEETYIVDRAARAVSYEVLQQGTENVFELKNRVFAATLPMADTSQFKIIGCSITYYDAINSFGEGLDFGVLGKHGVVARSEALVLSDAQLLDAYGANNKPECFKPNPDYSVSNGYPSGYAASIQNGDVHLGYRERLLANHPNQVAGWYAESGRAQYDWQVDPNGRGLILESLDVFGSRSSIDYDTYKLLPVVAKQWLDGTVYLSTTAEYDYRVMQAHLITDPNGNRAIFDFTPLGLLEKSGVIGKDTINKPYPTYTEEGDLISEQMVAGKRVINYQPTVILDYDFFAFKNAGEPVWVKTIKREQHYQDDPNPPTITMIEYTDGFGRALQTRTQAEDVLFGDSLFGDSGLPEDQTAQNQPAVGVARGVNDPLNVVVSGWKIYNNKGKVVEQYEPFFDKGFDYSLPFDLAALLVGGQSGEKIRMFYDPLGNVIRTVNPDNTEQWVIHGKPHALNSVEVKNHWSFSGYDPTAWESYTYDANDLATKIGFPSSGHDSTPKSAVINAQGKVVKTIDRLSQNDAEDVVMKYEYDIRGNVVKIIDPLNRIVFSHIYDLTNKSLVTIHIDSGTKTFVFDVMGKPAEAKDDKGAKVCSAFDALHRPKLNWAKDKTGASYRVIQATVYGEEVQGITNPQNTNHIGKVYKSYDEAGLNIVTEYDYKGNVLSHVKKVVKDSLLLNAINDGVNTNWAVTPYQTNWSTTPWNEEANLLEGNYETDVKYDALNRSIETKYPADINGDRKIATPLYNRAGALEKVIFDSTEYIKHMAYNAKGQELMIVYGNGLMTRYIYDQKTFRVKRCRTASFIQNSWTYTDNAGVKEDKVFTYDLVGNIVSTREESTDCGYGATPNQLVRQFSYDAVSRLLSATGRESNTMPTSDFWGEANAPASPNASNCHAYTQQFSYDKLGNILMMKNIATGNSWTRRYNYNSSTNKLYSLDDNQAIPNTLATFSYDVCGNQAQSNTERHYEWDYADRMKAFYNQTGAGVQPTVYAVYLYDSGGKRVKKMVRNNGGTWNSVTYIDGAFEYHTNGTEEKNYTQVPGSVEIRTGGYTSDITDKIIYQMKDHLGSVGIRIRSNGSTIDKEEFYPFGDSAMRTFEQKRYRYCGKEKDNESGLYYYGARYYMAWVGRFVSVDPLADKYAQLNPFNYAGNDPIGDFDIDGMQTNKTEKSANVNGDKGNNANSGTKANVNNTNSSNTYGYQWSNGVTKKSLNLSAGNYSLNVTDSKTLSSTNNSHSKSTTRSNGDNLKPTDTQGKNTSHGTVESIKETANKGVEKVKETSSKVLDFAQDKINETKEMTSSFKLEGKVTFGAQAGMEAEVANRKVGGEFSIASLTVLKGSYEQQKSDTGPSLWDGLFITGKTEGGQNFVEVNQSISGGIGIVSGGIQREFKGKSYGYENLTDELSLALGPVSASTKVNEEGKLVESKMNIVRGQIKLLVGFEFKISFGKTSELIKQ